MGLSSSVITAKWTSGKWFTSLLVRSLIARMHRGIYCLLAVATLLNLLTPELLAGVPEFLATCQTYEGGFCNASFPGWAFEAGQ